MYISMDISLFMVSTLGAMAAYLLGAIPFGYLIGRSQGVDIRTVGSCNTGATNVFRTVGKTCGIITFILDMAKGAAACRVIPWLCALIAGVADPSGITPYHVLCGALAVAGHNWPLFLGFKGGKGVATSAGMLLGLTPAGCGIAFLAWLVVMGALRYVSLASILAALALGVAAWPLYLTKIGVWFPLVLDGLAALAIWRHRANIKRLLAGTEPRVSFRKRPPAQ
jgi:glycerol-3-phosphate acyltransferase PlsY